MSLATAPVRIGVVDDISEHGDVGYRTAFEVGIADVLRGVGFDRQIELVYRYVHGLPRGTVQAVEIALRELHDEGVLAVLGPSITDNCLGIQSVVDELALPCLTWPGSEEARSEFMFQYQAGSLEDEPGVIADFLAAAGARRVAVVMSDAPTGRRYSEFFDRAARRCKLDVACRLGISAAGQPVPSQVFETIESTSPDVIVTFAMFGTKPFAEGLQERRSQIPVMANVSGSIGQNSPAWRTHLEGWSYLDMVSDGNTTLSRLSPQLPDGPRGARLVTGLDLGRAIALATCNAPRLDRSGLKAGLELIKRLPSAAGKEGTVLGFGNHDRAALKGEYLVVRSWVDGKSVEGPAPSFR